MMERHEEGTVSGASSETACGWPTTARALQQYLGHKNIQRTVRYTELAADRFKSLWENEA